MKRFKYKITDKESEREIWVCSACKKKHTREILLRKWKLFDISENTNTNIMCGICDNGKGDEKG